VINLDNNEMNSDWIRAASWDLPRTPESLLYKIGINRWEHFKTLPAFKAIPEGLEAKVDALVRARKASNPDLIKYDPDQPRDERGRFGSGGGGSSAPEGKLPKPVGEQQYSYDEITEIATPIEGGMVVRAIRETMATMSEKNGFSAKPTVVSKEEFDKIEGETFLRGVAPQEVDGTLVSGEHYANEFREGSNYYSYGGVYGTGIYFTNHEGTSNHYAWDEDGENFGTVMEMKMAPDAKIIDYEKAKDDAKYEFHQLELGNVDSYGNYFESDLQATQYQMTSDVGAWAMNHGYDAMSVKVTGYENYMVVLNRGAVITHA
jgi:hypothetical protein